MSKKNSQNQKEVKVKDKEEEEEPVVYLGYIETGDDIKQELTEASSSTSAAKSDDDLSPWLVNKIGGLPIFPANQVNVEELETLFNSLKCRHCKSPCFLVFQINSPIDDSTLDRVIQVYTCVKGDCIKHSWFTVRCMFGGGSKDYDQLSHEKTLNGDKERLLDLVMDARHGSVLVCRERAFFKPYFLSVIEEPTGRENFAKNNLEALKLASKFTDPDLKPAPIEAKYKNLKNYKPPQPPAHLSDLEDFEKFQMEKLYGNDKDMYRFYKRVGRFPKQVVRYDWEGQPLINSKKIKLNLQPCSSCSAKRKFELQLMSGLINYLVCTKESAKDEFDKETLDFSSIIVHSCLKNCSTKTFNLEDTYFMPDPDSRVFNKVKQKMLALKLKPSGSKTQEEEENVVDVAVVDKETK